MLQGELFTFPKQVHSGAAEAPWESERGTHDYLRHGTPDLFAALEGKTGRVIDACQRRHRATEFRVFLDDIDRNVPSGLEVHLVLDNLRTVETPEAAIQHYVGTTHAAPRPFAWTKSADDILDSVRQFCQHTNEMRKCQETSNSVH